VLVSVTKVDGTLNGRAYVNQPTRMSS
jgi:hypothetical protein